MACSVHFKTRNCGVRQGDRPDRAVGVFLCVPKHTLCVPKHNSRTNKGLYAKAGVLRYMWVVFAIPYLHHPHRGLLVTSVRGVPNVYRSVPKLAGLPAN